MEIQEIKQQLRIATVLNHYNIGVNSNRHCLCPFHKDEKPSLRIYEETNTYHCFGCGKTGDVIQFIQDIENSTKHEAITKAKELISASPQTSITPKTRQIETIDFKSIFPKLQQSLHRSKKAKEYLESRNIYDVKLEVAYNNGREFKQLKNCIIFPLKNLSGDIVSFYGRSLSKGHFYTANRKGLYPNYPSAETKTIVLTESVIDSATILKHTDYETLALYGTNGLTEEHTDAVSQLQQLEEIILFLDGDHAGREAIKTISEKLHKLLPKIIISHIVTPDDEDINSLLQGHEAEILNHLIEQRKTIYEVKNTELKPHKSKLNTENPEYIIYQSDSFEISVLGGILLHNLDKLKVTLKVCKKDTMCLRQSNLDLYNDDTLTKFIVKLTERLELSTKETQHVFYNFIDELENYRLEKLKENQVKEPQKRALTHQEKHEALKFLKAPNLLERTNELIGKTGLIGEENNRLLMFLVFTSRLREQPLHIISLGASGTGKTYLQEKIAQLIPDDHKLEMTALSENALYYFDRTELKNKLVLIEDLDGAQDDKILYAIRELMSKKRISKTLPIKDAKGNLKTVTLQVEGPITLAGTTTKEKIYEDNANRSILIYLDNSTAHKEAIINYQQKLSAGLVNKDMETKAMLLLQNIQRMLKPVKVRNPYAPQLKLPDTIFKPLRTHAHYLAFIETVTFYNQYQRQRKQDPNTSESFIETTIEDIKTANHLLKDVLLVKSDELTKGCRDFFERVKRHLKAENKSTFYSSEIRKSFRISPSNVKYYLAVLSKYNLITVIGGNPRRQGYEYEIVAQEEYENLKSNLNTLDKILEDLVVSS